MFVPKRDVDFHNLELLKIPYARQDGSRRIVESTVLQSLDKSGVHRQHFDWAMQLLIQFQLRKAISICRVGGSGSSSLRSGS